MSINVPTFLMTTPQPETAAAGAEKYWYSVWALPPADVEPRLKNLMSGLRAEYSGPEFDPHITLVRAISLTPEDAIEKFRSATKGLKAYDAKVDGVASRTGVCLLIHPTPQVVEASARCCGLFGYNRTTAYVPHLGILYADLTDEGKKEAQEKTYALDESIASLSFPVTRIALYKTDPEDKSLKSWEKIAECTLESN